MRGCATRKHTFTRTPHHPHHHHSQEKAYITQVTPTKYVIAPGFVPGMRVPGAFYVDASLAALVFDELADAVARGGGAGGGFLPAVKQVANVAALPGIVGVS